jgi:predicted phosphodiesterase
MRIAALYDVHGNIDALEAVLAEAGDADVLLFGGDIAWGPFPRRTLDLVRSLPKAEFIRGNADEANGLDEDRARFVRDELGEENVRWLESLPFSRSVDDTLFVHANPRDTEEPYFAWSPQEKLAAALDGVAESRVVSGHVHMQSNVTVGDKQWTCAGSVGYPYEGERGAFWALLADGSPEFRRTDYDVERTAAAIRSSGHPLAETYAKELLDPISPEEVRATWGG